VRSGRPIMAEPTNSEVIAECIINRASLYMQPRERLTART
jgi:hypothetical protein